MSWIQTFFGRKFDVLNPRAEDVNFNDIAVSLSMQCRFNGHTSMLIANEFREPRFYSVAHHCVVMSREINAKAALYALLHDAAEAYIGDLANPIKQLPEFRPFKEMERRIETVIYDAAGIPWPNPETENEVKLYDLRMLLTERQQLLSEPPEPWAIDSCKEIEPLDIQLSYEPVGQYAYHWLRRLAELGVPVKVEFV